MNVIPDTLEIDLNTNIPGFQTIRYKPYMTFPTISQLDDHVIFNPLMKLEKAKITDARIPEPIQRKQFLNQGLFDSMVYFHNTRQADTLAQAIDNGLIDRNIKITLDTLFKPNTKIYIRNQPYTVIDYTWKPGNWKIDVKSESTPNRFTVNRITDPYLYADVKNSQLREGANMLQQLPDKVRYGREYMNSVSDDSSSFLGKGITKPLVAPVTTKTPIQIPVVPVVPVAKTPAKTPTKTPPLVKTPTHYEVLGVKQNATQEEIKDAFRKKALSTHTDRNPDYKGEITFADVKKSADVLRDPDARNAYDVEMGFAKPDAKPVKPVIPVTKPATIPVTKPATTNTPVKPATINTPVKPAKTYTPSTTNTPSATSPPAKPEEPFMYPVSPSAEASAKAPVKVPAKVPAVKKTTPKASSVQFTASSNTKLLQDYFKQPDFIDLVDSIYKRTLRNSKNVPQFTDVEIVPGTYNINRETYIQSANSLTVSHNTGGGDCFFIAIADAINNYNEQNEDNRIIHGVVGKENRIFTQSYIRSIVAEDTNIDIEGLLIVASDLAEELNRVFRDTVSVMPAMTEAKYLELLADIYSSHPNTFVKMPSTYSLKDKSNPFRPYTKSDNLREYIMSSFYWADDMAVGLVSNALKINIIPLSQIEGTMSIPLIVANSSYKRNVFLYHNGFHYELITIKQPLSTISVFDDNTLPPFFLLFYIYAQYYFKLANKNDCKLYVDLLKDIDIGFNSHYETGFIKKFAKLFPVNVPILKNKVGAFLEGGGQKNGMQSGLQSGMQSGLQNGGQQVDVTQLYQRKSELAYNISIELELYKGVLNDEQIKDAKCQYKRKKIQTAYEELFGLQRSRIPDYKLIPKQQTRRFYPRNNVTYRYPSYSNYNNINPTNYTRRYMGGKKQRFTRKMRY